MRNRDRDRGRCNRPFDATTNEACQILIVNEVLNLGAAAKQRQHARQIDLIDQAAEHRAWQVAPDQPRSDNDRAKVLGDLLGC